MLPLLSPQVITGVGATSILGGEWEKAEGRNKEVRELFRCALAWYGFCLIWLLE